MDWISKCEKARKPLLALGLGLVLLFLLGSGGQVILQLTSLVSNDSNNSARWEPTAAVGTTWAMGWAELAPTLSSFVSTWDGSTNRWRTPYPLPAPGCAAGAADLNLAWDAVRARFVFTLASYCNPHPIWYGYSTNSSYTAWSNPTLVFSTANNTNWDYPSIAVDVNGRVIIGAVRTAPSLGYWAAVSTNGTTFTAPSALPVGPNGPGARVVAAGNTFHAFVPTLSANRPIAVNRYQSSNGVSWAGPYLQSAFGAPLNNTPPSQTSTVIFYAPVQLAAQGYANGTWVVAYQINVNGYNNIYTCQSDRGCGLINMWADDQFLVGGAVSAWNGNPGQYWYSYYTYPNPRNPPLMTQAIFFPAGQSPIGATVNPNVDPTGWTTSLSRCDPGVLVCYAAGDFHTTVANPYQAALTPFINRSSRATDLFQNFVADPVGPDLPNTFKPNFVPYPFSADLRSLAKDEPMTPGPPLDHRLDITGVTP